MAVRASIGSSERRRQRLALAGVALCVLGLAVTWLVAELVPAARVRDAAALRGFISLGGPSIDRVANGVLDLVGPIQCAVFCVVLIAIALARGRPRVALVIPVVLAGSVVCADLLKPLLGHAHDFVDGPRLVTADSWPSGHSTEAMAMALCALLAVPRSWRSATAAVGGVFTVAVAFSLLTLDWHMPSDVIGGFLMGGLWGALAVAALLEADRRWPARSGRRAMGRAGRALLQARGGSTRDGERSAIRPVLVLGVPVLVVLALLVLRVREVTDFATGHHSVVVVAAVITALAAALISSVAVMLRRE